MSEAVAFHDGVRECVEAVQSEESWGAVASFRHSERVNVIFGAGGGPGAGRGLSCQVEIIDPAVYFDPDRLPAGEAHLSEAHPFLAELVEDLADAIASAAGGDPVGPFVYRGLEPGTAASSTLFRTTIRDPG